MLTMTKQKYARLVLMKQERIVLTYQKRIAKELVRVNKELLDSYIKDGEKYFNRIGKEHAKNLNIILNDLAMHTNEVFKDMGYVQLKRLDPFEIINSEIENGIIAMLAANVLTTATDISATTVASASAEILRQIEIGKRLPNGIEPEQLADAIADKLAGKAAMITAKSRAMTIARTETHKAANLSQYTRAEAATTESGLDVEIEWISTNDTRVRDDHRYIEPKRIKMGESFNVGGHKMKHPSDPSAPASEVINCRCVLGYHVNE